MEEVILICKHDVQTSQDDIHKEQDPVSTMQKTGSTIRSSFLVWCSLEKGFTLDLTTRGQSTTVSYVLGHFWHGDQPGDPSASLLLTSEKAVFCNVLLLDGTKTTGIDKDSQNTLICTSGFVEDMRVALQAEL